MYDEISCSEETAALTEVMNADGSHIKENCYDNNEADYESASAGSSSNRQQPKVEIRVQRRKKTNKSSSHKTAHLKTAHYHQGTVSANRHSVSSSQLQQKQPSNPAQCTKIIANLETLGFAMIFQERLSLRVFGTSLLKYLKLYSLVLKERHGSLIF